MVNGADRLAIVCEEPATCSGQPRLKESCGRMQSSGSMEACIVGAATSLIWSLPYLLARCGFSVDVITTSPLLRASKFVRRVERIETLDEMVDLAHERICSRERPYDWVIAGDDETLWKLSRMHWPSATEPAYLPRTREGQIGHIFSKQGLSLALTAGGVKTPPFRMASCCADAVLAAGELGYPVLVKRDSDNGGNGVYRCESADDVRKLQAKLKHEPLLVQRLIAGREVDLSAIFFEQKLVHFAYSVIERTVQGCTALSALRTYYPLPLVGEEIFEEVAVLGRALDANGFVSISCIEAADGSGRYYFEADMRPNVWVDVSRFYGEDAAERIHGWFEKAEFLRKEDLGSGADCVPVRIPYFKRIARWELLVNRYNVWRFIPWIETSVVLRLLCARAVMPVARSVVPHGVRKMVKRGMIVAGIAFP